VVGGGGGSPFGGATPEFTAIVDRLRPQPATEATPTERPTIVGDPTREQE
jgi:hypothetical protein